MTAPGDKTKCPYCGRPFVGLADDGEPFFEKHLRECLERTPPDARSALIAMKLVKCECGSEEFKERAHYDRFRGQPPLWEYGCAKCGRIQTVQSWARKGPR